MLSFHYSILAGCTGKQEESTVAQTEATTEIAKKEVSLDGKWKIYNLRESLESILMYYNSVNQLNGSLILLFAAEKQRLHQRLQSMIIPQNIMAPMI